MIIKFWMGLSLAGVIGILLMIILGKIMKKKKNNQAAGSLLGFFLGLAIFICAWLISRRTYVVTGDSQYTHYMVFGSPEYTMDDGTVVKLDMAYEECMVINETDEPVVVEEVVYGGIFGGGTDWVHEHSYETMESHIIYYLFDSEPPDEISVNTDDDKVVRLWLRKKR